MKLKNIQKITGDNICFSLMTHDGKDIGDGFFFDNNMLFRYRRDYIDNSFKRTLYGDFKDNESEDTSDCEIDRHRSIIFIFEELGKHAINK
jgi:hypothetical protein